ncbi:MAG TPA: tRNA-dihydrouridine synthase [Xanthobacteraceae bacterium]
MEAAAHLAYVDGVMLGRAAYQEPWRLIEVDPLMFGAHAPFADAKDVAAALIPYIERELADGVRLHAITRHLHGLFQSVPGARAFRRRLAEAGASPQAGAALLREAFAPVSTTMCTRAPLICAEIAKSPELVRATSAERPCEITWPGINSAITRSATWFTS